MIQTADHQISPSLTSSAGAHLVSPQRASLCASWFCRRFYTTTQSTIPFAFTAASFLCCSRAKHHAVSCGYCKKSRLSFFARRLRRMGERSTRPLPPSTIIIIVIYNLYACVANQEVPDAHNQSTGHSALSMHLPKQCTYFLSPFLFLLAVPHAKVLDGGSTWILQGPLPFCIIHLFIMHPARPTDMRCCTVHIACEFWLALMICLSLDSVRMYCLSIISIDYSTEQPRHAEISYDRPAPADKDECMKCSAAPVWGALGAHPSASRVAKPNFLQIHSNWPLTSKRPLKLCATARYASKINLFPMHLPLPNTARFCLSLLVFSDEARVPPVGLTAMLVLINSTNSVKASVFV
ncbi:uncharacterized protein IWZ02DRAFT_259631 [Phyllosticta citriasiana]|uniref:Uncharacterized protein n=1 Tax=Phyllosticta citriasiana TaxID=595635 RepID=A0ABR1KSA1_9PEZI